VKNRIEIPDAGERRTKYSRKKMRIFDPELKIRSTKHETNPNDQNSNDKNKKF